MTWNNNLLIERCPTTFQCSLLNAPDNTYLLDLLPDALRAFVIGDYQTPHVHGSPPRIFGVECNIL
jgi:hypothetical protein